MTLKNYQKATLDVVRRYFELAQTVSPEEAYRQVTESAEAVVRLGSQRGYRAIEGLDETPVVAIKVPTGGGKTILAAHAVKLIAETQGRAYPLVLWFAPSDTIRRQTADALKKPSHPYRQALDAAFGGRVRVFDLDQKFDIRPADIAQNACVVVATEQAFVKKNTEKYKVYADHEALEPHFAGVSLEPGLEAREDEPTKPKTSFANLVLHHRAIVIVDEAHKMTSELSRETLARLRPSAVLGLSATPERGNNTVYSVWAKELFDEEMVKLPIELRERKDDWQALVLEAIHKREELQKLADEERTRGGDSLRPLVLFQATNVKGEVPVEKLKAFLLDEAKCRADEVAVVTGEQKELDDVDVAREGCPVKYVITVQALKEGWDCPSAYVLCSVANVASNTDTVQLLGRVMRQPQARRRKTPQLNRAYAYVLSSAFGAAAEELVNGLRRRGFEEGEAYRAIEVQAEFEGFTEEDTLFVQSDAVTLEKETLDVVAKELPEGVTLEVCADGSGAIRISENLSAEEQSHVVRALVKAGCGEKAAEFVRKQETRRRMVAERIPAKEHTLRLPRLRAEVQGEFVFSGEDAYAEIGEAIESELPPALGEDEFRLVPSGSSFQLFLDGNEMKTRPSVADEMTFLNGFSGVLEVGHVVNALDALVRSDKFSQVAKRDWIARIVAHLVSMRGYTPEQVYGYRFQLKTKLEGHIEAAYRRTREKAYQEVFGFAAPRYPLALDLDTGFALDANLYADDLPFIRLYRGGWHFTKHFLGAHRVPAFDGQKANGEGEEFDCAKLIDAHPRVSSWLRNLDSHRQSFRLPLAHGWFYPDFVGELTDGRLFAIEYKGAHLRNLPDTVAKDAIGRLWAKQDPAHCLYATVYRESLSGLDVQGQLDALFAG